MVWNAPLSIPFYGKFVLLGCAAWLLVLAFIQDGLKQVREAQAAEAAPTPSPAAA